MKPIDEFKVSVSFSLQAITKIMYLVMHETEEVGWRMISKRATDWDDNNVGYYIEDVLMYPQTVGPATVDTDEKELGDWENTLPDDVFNNMRAHGHSHVSMGVTPSATDIEHQRKILRQLGDDDFYIFIIVNKNLKMHFDIYDKRTGFHYEDDDVEYEFIGWKQPDLSLVKKPKPSYVFGGKGFPKAAPASPAKVSTKPKIETVKDPTGDELYDIFMNGDDCHTSIWDDIGEV